MNVLVVHDRKDVGEEIVQIVTDLCPGVLCNYAEDGSTARQYMHDSYYDLVIIDLTLPHIAGRGSPGFQVAEDLLQEVMSPGRIMNPGSILGITQDASALDTINNNIGPFLMAVVEEDVDGAWRKHIKDRIQYVKNACKSHSNALLTRHNYDVLIITALDKELAPYTTLFETRAHPKIPGLKEFVFIDKANAPRRGACYAIGRAGQPSAASETQGLICQLRPRLAIMTGFCGGVPTKADLGDIIFAEIAVDWDYGKWKPSEEMSKLYARPEPISIRNSKAHRVARDIITNGIGEIEELEKTISKLSNGEIIEAKFKMGPFASGSAVIGDENVLDSIKALNESISAVDMESFGFYYSSNYPHAAKPEYICIKAVADQCGVDKDDRLHKSCSFASAFVAKQIITRIWEY